MEKAEHAYTIRNYRGKREEVRGKREEIRSGRLEFADINKTVHDHIQDDVGKGTCTELVHDVLTMGDDGGEADVELVGNLFVDVTFGKEYRHLHLTRGELSGPSRGVKMRSVHLGIGVSFAMNGKDGLDQCLFCLTDIEGRHTRNLEVAIDEHDGTTRLLTEIGSMFEIEARCHEVVHELPVVSCLKFVEGDEDVHLSYRNEVGEDRLQPQGS